MLAEEGSDKFFQKVSIQEQGCLAVRTFYDMEVEDKDRVGRRFEADRDFLQAAVLGSFVHGTVSFRAETCAGT